MKEWEIEVKGKKKREMGGIREKLKGGRKYENGKMYLYRIAKWRGIFFHPLIFENRNISTSTSVLALNSHYTYT